MKDNQNKYTTSHKNPVSGTAPAKPQTTEKKYTSYHNKETTKKK